MKHLHQWNSEYLISEKENPAWFAANLLNLQKFSLKLLFVVCNVRKRLIEITQNVHPVFLQMKKEIFDKEQKNDD